MKIIIQYILLWMLSQKLNLGRFLLKVFIVNRAFILVQKLLFGYGNVVFA